MLQSGESLVEIKVLYSEGFFLVMCRATLENYCVQKSRRRTTQAELSFTFNLLFALQAKC